MTFEQYLIDKKITDLSPHLKAVMLKAWEAATEVEAAKYKPISVEERLPENSVFPWKGFTSYEDTVIAYTEDKTFIAAFNSEDQSFYADCDLIEDVTHWLPIPEVRNE